MLLFLSHLSKQLLHSASQKRKNKGIKEAIKIKDRKWNKTNKTGNHKRKGWKKQIKKTLMVAQQQ